ncbi:MAG TPA: S9 family peptidase [Rhizomicrobium sp.]|nr:S9 family peptidase [Rhizomicrobium sp.]
MRHEFMVWPAKLLPGRFAGLLLTIFLASGFLNCAAATLTPTQVLDYTRAADLHFSPDGRKLAYIVWSYPLDWKPRIRVLDIATGKVDEITPPKKAERAPQWSPDGQMLAFLSNRDGKPQVYLMPAEGGQATALTSAKNGVSAYHWSPDGKSIAYLAKDDTAPSDDDDPQIADDERKLARLWVVDVATKMAKRLGKAGYRIDEFQWQTPARILIAATGKPRVEEYTDAVYALSVPGGALTLVGKPPQPFEYLMVAPDGKQFAVHSTRANGPEARDLFVGTIGGNDLRDVSRSVDLSVVQMQWHGPSRILMTVQDGFHTRLYELTQDAKPEEIKLPLSIGAFDAARDGSIAFTGEDFSHLQEIYVRAPDGRIRQLTHMQIVPVAGHLAPTTIFSTRSFDGTPIEAALVKPAAGHGKLPLVLLVHGGPSSRFTAGYTWETAWAQLLASHGYEVLMVNPRGSNGYSEDFMKANRGDWGGGDYKDLMTVLDAVIAKGDTDPNRLGIGGWSYGGEMTMWAITQSDRFKAAVAGAGVYDQQAEFETEPDPQGDEWYFGTPWSNPETYARNSPSTYIAKAHTPTLIFAGADDEENPVGQSKGLYRALKHLGVESELVLYPGEGHSPKKGSYNVDMFQRILDWYDGHLGKIH